MQANDLIDRVAKLDGGAELARDLRKFINGRKLGLVYEESKPEYVRLTNKPVVAGDLVNILPPRGTMEDMTGDDASDIIWQVRIIDDTGRAVVVAVDSDDVCEVAYDDLVAVARFDQTIYCGLKETGRVERGGDKPYHAVINGENFHALELLMYPYQGKVDCIYIDPPYNTGAKDWKYNNNYVGAEDTYRHSKWLTFMEDRLRLAKKLLNPEKSVLIVTIDEKEYLRLGLLLEQMFPEASAIQMVSININPAGVSRHGEFGRCDEYAFFVMMGERKPIPHNLGAEWITTKGRTHTGHIRWDLLKRSGTRTQRSDSPGCFYPIYAKDGVIQSIGDAIPIDADRQNVKVPEGFDAIWPIRQNGTEGNWQLSPKNLRALWQQGFVKLGKAKGSAATVYYLKPGERAKIDNGTYEVIGRDVDGSVITSDSEELIHLSMPTTQWKVTAHDSTQYGSRLLQKFLGGKRFTFPKSLYAVEDTLRFFVADSPNALIVDFFAGSGTTAHAVMRLNYGDGGRRRSISVTNNEVSFEETKRFVKQGLRQGDEEWEAHGIARYVTIPRVTAAITGLTPEGEPIKGDYKFTDEFPMAEGFEENAVFYDLTYIEPSVLKANLAFDEIAPLLWMRAGSVGPIIMLGDTDPDDADYEVTDTYGVLFDYAWAPEFVEECKSKGVEHVFVVTDVDRQYRDMCAEFRGKDVRQLYKSYLRSFEIGQDR